MTSVSDRRDLLADLKTSLGASYAIERELGGGGMSRVFVATDASLGRRVVIKVLAPELVQGLSVERFAREIKLAAALQDPHIVPVHAAGTTSDGLPYYTMPFVEGESLRARMLRGALSPNDAISILRDVAMALEYAHAHGIVHRDIKPENVLLAGRTAVVADFGIAKAVSAARTIAPGQRSGTITSVGTSLGTPAYMAPEQAVGDATDHRADIYAWGMMAYELLAGAHPFAHRTSQQQLVAAQLSEVPEALDTRRPGLPLPIPALVMQCVEKDASKRPSSAAELVSALDAAATPVQSTPVGMSATGRARKRSLIVAGSLVTVAVLGIGGWFASRSKNPGVAADDPRAHSIAVLPFEHRGDSADVYFTDGMTDEVRGKLMAVPGLSVIARGSSNPYRGSTKTPKQIAEELGVRYLLTGTVQLVGTGAARRVIVRPELVEVMADGQPQARWQAPFEADVKDVVRVQGDIAGRVTEAMQVALGAVTQERLNEGRTRDAVAYDLYLRGQAAWSYGAGSDGPALNRARELFEQAVLRDSTLVEAWTQLARVASTAYNNLVPTPELARLAERSARRALAIAPDGPDGLLALGSYLRIVERDMPGAFDALQRARRIAPSHAVVAAEYAFTLGEMGRFDDALRAMDVACELDPRAPRPWVTRARLLLRMRRIDEARSSADRAIALAPTALNAVSIRVGTELAAGDLVAARRVIANAKRDLPSERVIAYIATYWDLGWVLDADDERALLALSDETLTGAGAGSLVRTAQHGWRGEWPQARAAADSANLRLAAQEREAPNDPQRPVIRAIALAHAGRSAEALAAARRGIALSRKTPSAHSHAYFLYVAARAALVAGDRDQALAWLRESLDRRFFATPAWVRLDPSWKPLHGDPRFEQLLAEAK